MTLQAKIKAEIKRLKHTGYAYHRGAYEAICTIEDFINSLQAEPVSEDLEKVLPGTEQYAEQIAGRDYVPVDWVETLDEYGKWKIVRVEPVSEELGEAIKKHRKELDYYGMPCGYKDASCSGFQAGANWQKEQMLEDAVECKVLENDADNGDSALVYIDGKQLYPEQRVKLIIIKV